MHEGATSRLKCIYLPDLSDFHLASLEGKVTNVNNLNMTTVHSLKLVHLLVGFSLWPLCRTISLKNNLFMLLFLELYFPQESQLIDIESKEVILFDKIVQM